MKKLPKLSTMRNKCDALLTPIIKNMFPYCLLCNGKTEVAHHHIHKGASTRLRYEIDNLIPLCNHCHLALHMQESYHASRIVSYRGLDWFNRLVKMKQEIVKADVHYYIANYERLKSILEACG
jgi:5-methylcytosine-specific restriction endonuclease McrA